MTDRPDFASRSLPRHLIRGVLGIGALIASVGSIPVFGPVTLLLAPVGLVFLRGCPMCWAIGLAQTISRGRLRRSCTGDGCVLTVAGHATVDRHQTG
ncbi:hypothetical protein LX16_3778 [Stackebrandtia albiflava]|uniref:Uncharacterized protein n=1 Tax=Stackebrandtia albiflava TaxID=406432 RepID=A0A562V535_9ACTN|nr:hypothetical protein [Stackebrandtia albiflava]TWJ13011.1 hypothetical protein LX16_3778 [Stackebrandtia albiflava]